MNEANLFKNPLKTPGTMEAGGSGGGKISNPDLLKRSMRDVENNPMPSEEIIAEKVKEALADKSIAAKIGTTYYFLGKEFSENRIAEFWVRYSYDIQAGEGREMTGWEPLVDEFQVKDIINKYYLNYYKNH